MRGHGFPWIMLVIPAAFCAAVLVAHALLLYAPPSIATDLAQPLPVATTWHDFGRSLWLATFACILLAGIPYIVLLQGIVRRTLRTPPLWMLCALSAAAMAAALCMPVVFSSDVYAYAAYGLMQANGVSPYGHSTITLHDPLLRAAIWQWSNPLPVCVYGPLFVGISKTAVVAAAHFGAAAQLLALRIVSSLAILVSGLLMYAAFDGSRERRITAAACILLNPVVIWSAAEGHNDSLMLLIVLLGFVCVRKFGYFIGAFVIAASALIKASGAVAAIILAVFAWPDRKRVLTIMSGFAAGIVLTAILSRPFESGVQRVLVPHGHYTPQFSAQYIIEQFATTLFGKQVHAIELAIAAAAVASGLLALYGARLALRKDPAGSAYFALGLWLLIPNPYPWYALWILPIAALCLNTAAGWAIVLASLTIFLRYLPDVSSATNADANVLVTICELAVPFVILSGRWRALSSNAALESDSRA